MGDISSPAQRARPDNAIRSERLALYPPCAQMKVIALLFTILAVATGFASPPNDDPTVPGRTTYSGGLFGGMECVNGGFGPCPTGYECVQPNFFTSSCQRTAATVEFSLHRRRSSSAANIMAGNNDGF